MRCLIDFPETSGGRLRHAFADSTRVLIAWRHDEVRPLLREVDVAAQAGSWCVGMVAYEAAPAFDAAFQVRGNASFPLAVFAVFDTPQPWPEPPGSDYCLDDWRPDSTAERFARDFAAIQSAILEGAVYQINYTTRLRCQFAGHAHAYFDLLRANQPDGYCASLDWGTHCVLSVSPELFFRREQGRLTVRPMKGTAPRGATAGEDRVLAEALRSSAKERAENLMIVDLLRNDLGRIAVPGSVSVASLFDVEVLPTALQMTSTIRATPRPCTRLDDVFAALFPCGSVTGAPKISAMQHIASLESAPRGVYCGALGVVKPGGDAVFSVAIRSIVLEAAQGDAKRRAVYGVGSGIVADSTLAGEAFEFRVKTRLLRRAAKPFALLETLRLEGGRVWLLERHLLRLRESARHFGFAFDEAAMREALANIALAHANGTHRLRLLLERDGTTKLEPAPLREDHERESKHAQVQLATAPIDQEDEFLYHKTTQRDHYDRHTPTDPAYFDTLLWNASGELTEFTRGNLVLDLHGRLVTPPLSSGLLPGTLRQELLESGKIVEARVTSTDLDAAKAIWFINSLRGWVRAKIGAASLAQARA
jgi:para-aminobenzoate synthetase / 4-amino-4-deoxychorismate lyase